MIARYNCLCSCVSSSPISLINLNPLDPASPLGFGIAVISACWAGSWLTAFAFSFRRRRTSAGSSTCEFTHTMHESSKNRPFNRLISSASDVAVVVESLTTSGVVFVLVCDPGHRTMVSRRCGGWVHNTTYLNLNPSSADFSSLWPWEQLSKRHSLWLVLPWASKVLSSWRVP